MPRHDFGFGITVQLPLGLETFFDHFITSIAALRYFSFPVRSAKYKKGQTASLHLR